MNKKRFAIFSDIHANLAALKALLYEAESLNVDSLFCCGDVVGYGAEPNECCEMLRERGIAAVMGNHDYAALHPAESADFNPIARTAIQWTHDQLTPENTLFLSKLPFVLEHGILTFAHASPIEPKRWRYVLNLIDALDLFNQSKGWVSFIGHSHQPFAIELDNGQMHVMDVESGEVKLNVANRYLVNVGSVGQPRDRNPRLCFVTMDMKTRILKFHRLPYPVALSQNSILLMGLPSELSERLKFGW